MEDKFNIDIIGVIIAILWITAVSIIIFLSIKLVNNINEVGLKNVLIEIWEGP